MIEKYIIGKEDLPKLIRGEELSLSQGSKARALKIEIIGNLTNGDIIKAMFPQARFSRGDFGISEYFMRMNDNKMGFASLDVNWWNAPYEGGKEE